MKVLIVESPNKVKKLGGFLGKEWRVVASVGHIRDLPKNEMGVEPPQFKPKYVAQDRGKQVIARLKKSVEGADEIYLATDPDREGEAIAWHVQDALALKRARRVTFNEITKKAVLEAIRAPREIDRHLVHAQEARRITDRLVGYMVSPVLSQKSGRNGLSAGRVQSVALRLVVDREREIANHKPIAHYGARLFFNTDGVKWHADWDFAALAPKGQRLWTDRAMAARAAAVRNVTITKITCKDTPKSAPAPFTTATLQQAASVALGINPKKTMQLAQRLFEEGLITYHRTDSQNLSDEAIADIRRWATANNLAQHLPESPNRWKSKAGAQEAHEAIRPTHIDDRSIEIDDPQAAELYSLIWERAVASQFKAARYDVTTVELVESGAASPLCFKAIGRVETYPGWRVLSRQDAAEESDDVQDEHGGQALPKLREKSAHSAVKGEVIDKKTEPPARYTEASLIKKLEAEGIGRPSTYASIIDNIISRQYVTVDKKKRLHAEPLGEQVIDLLVGSFGFVEYGFTRDMERDLDAIAEGKNTYLATVTRLYQVLQTELGGVATVANASNGSETGHTCPQCGKSLRRLKNKNRDRFFWGCTGYPECAVTFPDNDGAPGERTEALPQSSEVHPCPQCGKPMRRRNGSNGPFWGCSGYPHCKHTLPDEDGRPGQRLSNKAN